MRRVALSLFALLGLLLAASPAYASDASLVRAMKPYKARLTADIGYLSGFSAPSAKAAPAALRRLVKVQRDLTGATKAAKRNHASTKRGRVGRTQVLSALRYAKTAASYARASAKAARAHHRSAARRKARAEQVAIDRAIPLFEAGGRRLHLF